MILAFVMSALAGEPATECTAFLISMSGPVVPKADLTDAKLAPTRLPAGWSPIGGVALNAMGGALNPYVIACRTMEPAKVAEQDALRAATDSKKSADADKTRCAGAISARADLRAKGWAEAELPPLAPECAALEAAK